MISLKKIIHFLKKPHVIFFLMLSLAALIGLLIFRNFPGYQILIITALVIGYLAWAINYHRRDKSLHFEIVLEYILTALLVLIVFYVILI